jgi:hypothetical protein
MHGSIFIYHVLPYSTGKSHVLFFFVASCSVHSSGLKSTQWIHTEQIDELNFFISKFKVEWISRLTIIEFIFCGLS